MGNSVSVPIGTGGSHRPRRASPTSMGLWPATPRPHLSGPGLGPKEARMSRRHRPGRQARGSSTQDAGDPPRPHTRARAQHRPELPPRRGGEGGLPPGRARQPIGSAHGRARQNRPSQWGQALARRPRLPRAPRNVRPDPGRAPAAGTRAAPPITSLTLVERERSSLVADAGSCAERRSHRLHGRCPDWPAPLESWRTPPARLDGHVTR